MREWGFVKGAGIEAVGAPPPPRAAELIYLEAFGQVSREIGFNGPQPLAVSEIAAWLDLRGFKDARFRASVLKVLKAMDAVFMAHAFKASKPQEDPSGKRVRN